MFRVSWTTSCSFHSSLTKWLFSHLTQDFVLWHHHRMILKEVNLEIKKDSEILNQVKVQLKHELQVSVSTCLMKSILSSFTYLASSALYVFCLHQNRFRDQIQVDLISLSSRYWQSSFCTLESYWVTPPRFLLTTIYTFSSFLRNTHAINLTFLLPHSHELVHPSCLKFIS